MKATCTECGETKGREEFYKDPYREKPKMPCKECHRAKCKRRHRSKKVAVRDYDPRDKYNPKPNRPEFYNPNNRPWYFQKERTNGTAEI